LEARAVTGEFLLDNQALGDLGNWALMKVAGRVTQDAGHSLPIILPGDEEEVAIFLFRPGDKPTATLEANLRCQTGVFHDY
jgi:hypothetical protein